MTIVYFDSSAFVKLLIDEPGSELAAELWNGCDAPLSSRLAYPEVRAALGAAGRAHRLSRGALRRAETTWGGFWAATRAVELTESIAAHAGDLAGAQALRGADAIHLASVLALRTSELVFAVWDQRLRTSAQANGITTSPA